ncbi:hypothetical protein ACVMH6_000882 [Rhizobium leguminosarum]
MIFGIESRSSAIELLGSKSSVVTRGAKPNSDSPSGDFAVSLKDDSRGFEGEPEKTKIAFTHIATSLEGTYRNRAYRCSLSQVPLGPI